ncbi:peptidyl-tRNA hydrolase [Curtobacterium sp. MCBD17_040]|uniref:peptidyl-tRNA hydrolase n=1 Tax=Curtobacterium sp. MCBD17_040 TaxID=2175674 RepID=UPI0011B78C47|nr:peptidyl-tRNA hydrolase [Curtobacterium sp. MCBD17_040]WIB65351.1 peptidyl-tRNA hydrolase [Curtobacterium sp. MCBD17_040]
MQVIVMLVDRDDPCDDRDGIAAVAAAAAAAFRAGAENPVWQEWFGEAMAKSVRRADVKMFGRVREQFPDAAHVRVGAAEALAFPPIPNDALPKLLSRLQVSGTVLPRLDAAPASDGSSAVVLLNADLDMSTGKAAAQAAHAFVLWVGETAGALPAVPSVQFASKATLEQAVLTFSDAALVVDAGRTEVAPDSLTAVAHGTGER